MTPALRRRALVRLRRTRAISAAPKPSLGEPHHHSRATIVSTCTAFVAASSPRHLRAALALTGRDRRRAPPLAALRNGGRWHGLNADGEPRPVSTQARNLDLAFRPGWSEESGFLRVQQAGRRHTCGRFTQHGTSGGAELIRSRDIRERCGL